MIHESNLEINQVSLAAQSRNCFSPFFPRDLENVASRCWCAPPHISPLTECAWPFIFGKDTQRSSECACLCTIKVWTSWLHEECWSLWGEQENPGAHAIYIILYNIIYIYSYMCVCCIVFVFEKTKMNHHSPWPLVPWALVPYSRTAGELLSPPAWGKVQVVALRHLRFAMASCFVGAACSLWFGPQGLQAILRFPHLA